MDTLQKANNKGADRLRRCTGWSAALLFAIPRKQVFLWRGLFHLNKPTEALSASSSSSADYSPFSDKISIEASPECISPEGIIKLHTDSAYKSCYEILCTCSDDILNVPESGSLKIAMSSQINKHLACSSDIGHLA